MTSRSGPARTRLHLTAVLFALAVVLAAMPAGAAATWTRVNSPNRGSVGSALQDVVTVPGTSTSWAVGWSYDSNVAAYRTLTERSTGGAWSIVSSPNPSGSGYSQLNRVDASSASNVWAIGYDSQTGTLVERFDGTRWATVPAPAGVAARALDVVSPTEVWVAGYSGSAAIVARWNGNAWATVYTQPVANRHLTVFEGIAAGPGGHVWAVGWDRDYNAPGRPVSSLVVHFDTSTWTRESTPNPANRNTLNDVVALDNGDVFAAGVAQTTSGGGIVPRSLLLRRTGGSWSSLNVPPGETGSQDQLLSVAAVSGTSVWAVGYYNSPSSGLYEPLLVHWTANGAAGTLATAQPSPALTVSGLAAGVTASPGGTLWAAGYTSPPGAGNATLILKGTGG